MNKGKKWIVKNMKTNTRLENMLCEAGQMLDIGKDEIKHAVLSRKNIVVIGLMAFFAFVFVHNITYGTLRYAAASIHDFIQLGKFL